MSKRNTMPGLRLKGDVWQIEKRCKFSKGGWLRESTGKTSRIEAEKYLIHRLVDLEQKANQSAIRVHDFEEAGLQYLEDIAHKAGAETQAMHLEQLFGFINNLSLEHIHDGTLKPFVQHETKRGKSPKTINNAIGVVATVLNRAARVWRNDDGTPWLKQAPPLLTRLSTKGKSAKAYPLSWDEQDALFRILPRYLADAALYAVNTGCREQEVCQLRWSWEVKIDVLNCSVFVLPEAFTKTSTERIVVLNGVAMSIIESRRGIHPDYVFTYKDNPVKKLRTSSWRRAWEKAGLPMEKGILKGVHNLRHTFGRRLRAAGIALETRKTLLGHANGDITTHYSAAEINELKDAVNKITDHDIDQMPTLALITKSKLVSAQKIPKTKGIKTSNLGKNGKCRKFVGNQKKAELSVS